jgi:hypothetical protein
VFLDRRQAIDYAKGRASYRSGEIRILDLSGNVRTHHYVRRDESKIVTPRQLLAGALG